MNSLAAKMTSALSWVGTLSLAQLFSSHRIEVKLLKEQVEYEKSERKRERDQYEADRKSWEIERQRLSDRLHVKNGVPPVHAQLPQRQPTGPVNRQPTVEKAMAAKRAEIEEEKRQYQEWLKSMQEFKNQNGNQEQAEFPGDEAG